jgi:cation:H+ antiporter
VDIASLFVAFLVILAGAELFTNGIEWFGRKLQLAEGAVGSVLAAVGTALPETMIPIIAILFSGSATANEVGIGAILGAPFMLATLAMFVTGIAVLYVSRRHRPSDEMPVDTGVLWHDIRFFVIAYGLAVGVAFVPADLMWPRIVVAVVLLGIYAYYVREHFQAETGGDHATAELAPLRFHRLDMRGTRPPNAPRLRVVTVQVIVALACIVVGATVFVWAVEDLAHSVGVDEALLALVIAPIATELPEKFNSVIWVRQGKDTLAMGNITGAMVFQATIPTVVALVFASSHWAVGPGTLIVFASAAIAFLSTAAIFIPMARRHRLQGSGLLVGGLFYVGYLALVVASVAGVID